MRPILVLLCSGILAAADAPILQADFEGAGSGFTVTGEGKPTAAEGEVIAGKKSLCLDGSGPQEFKDIFVGGEGAIPANTLIEYRFDYRWLSQPPPSNGNPKEDVFMYCSLRGRHDRAWTEKRFDEFSGRSGVVRRVVNSGPDANNRLIIGMHKHGRLAIDNLILRVLSPSTAPIPEQVGPPAGEQWVKVPELSDEFNGDQIDQGKWELGAWDWESRKPAAFDKRNLSLADGRLALQLNKVEYSKDPVLAGLPQGYHTWTSASLHSRATQQYGFFEIRAKPVCATASSAFWLGDNNTEIDVFEIGGSSAKFMYTVNSTLHVFPRPWNDNMPHLAVSSGWDLDRRPVDDFHIYSLQWDEKQITVRVDGDRVADFTNTYWHRPMPIIFDVATMPDWFGLPRDSDRLPATFQIDWIRTWRRAPQTGTP